MSEFSTQTNILQMCNRWMADLIPPKVVNFAVVILALAYHERASCGLSHHLIFTTEDDIDSFGSLQPTHGQASKCFSYYWCCFCGLIALAL